MNIPIKNINNIISLIDNTKTSIIYKSMQTNYKYQPNMKTYKELELIPLHIKHFIILETT